MSFCPFISVNIFIVRWKVQLAYKKKKRMEIALWVTFTRLLNGNCPNISNGYMELTIFPVSLDHRLDVLFDLYSLSWRFSHQDFHRLITSTQLIYREPLEKSGLYFSGLCQFVFSPLFLYLTHSLTLPMNCCWVTGIETATLLIAPSLNVVQKEHWVPWRQIYSITREQILLSQQ